MQSQFDFPYNFPKRRSAYCLDSLHGAWNFSHAKHSIVYDCCKAELEDQASKGRILSFYIFFLTIGKHHEGWLQADHIHI